MNSNPTTPEACRAEQVRVKALLKGRAADETWAFFTDGSFAGEIRRTSGDYFGHLFDEVAGDDGVGNLAAAAPSLARAYLALLDAHAEALERLERVSAVEKALRGAEPDVAATLRAILPAPPASASAEGASHD